MNLLGGTDMPTGNRPGQSGLTHIQALYFDLIQTINYNELNGFQVVEDLLQWRDLWYSVIADRQPYPRLGAPRPGQYGVYPPLALLRTTRYDEWPADTIYIWTDAEQLPRLRRLRAVSLGCSSVARSATSRTLPALAPITTSSSLPARGGTIKLCHAEERGSSLLIAVESASQSR